MTYQEFNLDGYVHGKHPTYFTESLEKVINLLTRRLIFLMLQEELEWVGNLK